MADLVHAVTKGLWLAGACLGIVCAGCDVNTIGKAVIDTVAGGAESGSPPPPPPPGVAAKGSTSSAAATGTAAATIDLYAEDQGGEQVLPADKAPEHAPLRAAKKDTFYRLSNARLNERGTLLLIDYDRVRDGMSGVDNLAVRTPDGDIDHVLLMWPLDRRGTLEIEQRFRFRRTSGLPKDAEFYLTTGGRKVSNSVVMGSMPSTTLARDWTAAEIDSTTVAYRNPNRDLTIGEDTRFAGTAGTDGSRYLEAQGMLLGIETRLGAWDGQQCIGHLVPVFKRDQPKLLSDRVLAPEGYAVGAMEVHAQRYVNALKVVYMKIKPDGTLDSSDSQASEWIGYPGSGAPITLGGDGRRVIGLNIRQFGVVDGVALIMQKKSS